MKLKLFTVIILINFTLRAMQPAQLLREVEPKVATESLINLIPTMALAKEAPIQEESQALYSKIERLLKQGGNPNVFNDEYIAFLPSNPGIQEVWTLLNASIPHFPEITKLLLNAGAQPTEISLFVGDPQQALYKPLQKIENLDPILIEKIRKGRATNYHIKSENPLSRALVTSVPPYRLVFARMLLSAGAIPIYKHLYDALQNQDADLVSLLLNYLPWPPPHIDTLNRNDQYYIPKITHITNELKYSPDPYKNEILKLFEMFENPLLSAIRQADVARVQQLIAAGQEDPFEPKEGPAPNLPLQSPYQLAFEKYGDPQIRHLKLKYKRIIELLESDTKHKAEYLKKTREWATRLKK